MLFFGKKVEKILKGKNGQDALIEIDNLLTPIFYETPEELTPQEKNIVYIEELEREVNDGGFNQYFINTSGDYVKETLEALKIIGSKIFFELLQKAVNKFPNGTVPQDRDERIDIVNVIDENIELWEDLDEEFYNYEEDIYTLMVNYIKNNIKDFR